jgi:hypothetical protein
VTNALRTADDYELFLYSIPELFPIVQRSTLRFVRRGATLARVDGEIEFAHQFRISIRERIVFDRLPATIDGYSYEVWRGDEQLFWYDTQPHPADAALRATHPHHKHLPPDLRNNRVVAPNLIFHRPNMHWLIQEVNELLSAI